MSYSNDLKGRVLKHVNSGGNQVEACRLYGVDRKTIYNWVKNPILTTVKVRRSRNGKLDKALLSAHVRDFPDALLRERALHFKVSASGIWRSLQRMNIVKKNDQICRKKSHKKNVVFA